MWRTAYVPFIIFLSAINCLVWIPRAATAPPSTSTLGTAPVGSTEFPRSACRKKNSSSSTQQTASVGALPTNTINCTNVEGALSSWTTSYRPLGALAVLSCYPQDPVSVKRRQERAPSSYPSISTPTIADSLITSFTAICLKATQGFWSCFSSWESYLNRTERGAPPTIPALVATDECDDEDYLTKTCVVTGAAIYECLWPLVSSLTATSNSTQVPLVTNTTTTVWVTKTPPPATTYSSTIWSTTIIQDRPPPTTSTFWVGKRVINRRDLAESTSTVYVTSTDYADVCADFTGACAVYGNLGGSPFTTTVSLDGSSALTSAAAPPFAAPSQETAQPSTLLSHGTKIVYVTSTTVVGPCDHFVGACVVYGPIGSAQYKKTIYRDKPSAPPSLATATTAASPRITTFTAACPTATEAFWSCFSSWESMLNCTEMEASAAMPSSSITDGYNTCDYFTTTCTATNAAISSCFTPFLTASLTPCGSSITSTKICSSSSSHTSITPTTVHDVSVETLPCSSSPPSTVQITKWMNITLPCRSMLPSSTQVTRWFNSTVSCAWPPPSTVEVTKWRSTIITSVSTKPLLVMSEKFKTITEYDTKTISETKTTTIVSTVTKVNNSR